MRPRLIAAGLLALSLTAPATALANGDPASDVLLESKIYFPTQRVGVDEAKALHQVVDAANAKGYAIRVALIKDPTDLGTVPNLLNKAQEYSEFLGPEIRFAYKGDLLVVMPNGMGLTTTDATPPPAKAIAGMLIEAGGSSNGLALTAGEAVRKLAAASGHPVEAKKGGGGGGGGGILVAVGALAVLALGAGAAFWVRRSAPGPEAEPSPDEPAAP